MPEIADRGLYKGISIHSSEYKNAEVLKEQGVKVHLPGIYQLDQNDC
jgi:hypothetical protein